tara:strand:+ start:300 stop:1556 length:1257 start_codon:yes stop_codon:yes gene_type:complete
MNILVLGNGGREHAICYALKKSPILKNLWCYPGNAGISELAIIIKENLSTNKKIKDFCLNNKIDLVIPGSESYLARGIVDELEKEGIKAFGPSKKATQLESSKIFTKKICEEANIPTAEWSEFNKYNDAIKFIATRRFPLVIKADGLAAGKGVTIAKNHLEAELALKKIFKGYFGKAGKKVLIEQFLEGREASFFVICDGEKAIPFSNAQDHKRLSDGNTGPNTGGMGAYSPTPLIDKHINSKIMNTIINPTLKLMKKKNIPYKGFLYAGLMITNKEPKLIEYNVRLGDPECQVIIPRLQSDFLQLCLDASGKKLEDSKINFIDKTSLCIVMSSKGYPENYKTGLKITGLDNIKNNPNIMVFHAGTAINKKNQLVSSGGRVLNINSLANNISEARQKAYSEIKKVSFHGSHYRSDIGL